MLIVVGVLTYYGVPLSFLNGNLLYGFLILGFVLILIVLGMTFLFSLLFNYMERLLLWITLATCCRKDRHIYSLILKQMRAHQVRNNKTSLIFTLAVAFLLFASSYFLLVSTLIDKAFA